MDVEPQDAAEQVGVVLPGLERIAAAAAIAERRVEVAVGTEFDPAALVVRQAVRLIDPEQQRLARRIGAVRVG